MVCFRGCSRGISKYETICMASKLFKVSERKNYRYVRNSPYKISCYPLDWTEHDRDGSTISRDQISSYLIW
jgi:hypothetical protein